MEGPYFQFFWVHFHYDFWVETKDLTFRFLFYDIIKQVSVFDFLFFFICMDWKYCLFNLQTKSFFFFKIKNMN